MSVRLGYDGRATPVLLIHMAVPRPLLLDSRIIVSVFVKITTPPRLPRRVARVNRASRSWRSLRLCAARPFSSVPRRRRASLRARRERALGGRPPHGRFGRQLASGVPRRGDPRPVWVVRRRIRAAGTLDSSRAVHEPLRPHQVGPLGDAEPPVPVRVRGVELRAQRRATQLLGVVPRAHLVRPRRRTRRWRVRRRGASGSAEAGLGSFLAGSFARRRRNDAAATAVQSYVSESSAFVRSSRWKTRRPSRGPRGAALRLRERTTERRGERRGERGGAHERVAPPRARVSCIAVLSGRERTDQREPLLGRQLRAVVAQRQFQSLGVLRRLLSEVPHMFETSHSSACSTHAPRRLRPRQPPAWRRRLSPTASLRYWIRLRPAIRIPREPRGDTRAARRRASRTPAAFPPPSRPATRVAAAAPRSRTQ